MPAKPMTPKQERFAVEYVVDLSPGRAYERAGYSATGRTADAAACRLLTDVNVLNRIAELRKEQEERILVTADYVVTSIHEVAERCLQRSAVMVGRGKDRAQLTDEDGNHVWAFDATGANKSLELLGKHVGIFGPKGSVEDPIHSVQITIITDDDRQRRLDELRKHA